MRVAACLLALCIAALARPALAEGSAEKLARDLSNPVASLTSVPFQFNWDEGHGPGRDGRRLQLNVQPVVPFAVAPGLNVISRTIVPLVDQRIPLVGDGSQSGVGDITQSFFLTPAPSGSTGFTWGAGPVVLIPTYADAISAGRWGAGPTAVALRQRAGFTYGALANHLWSIGGSSRPDISTTFVQPFLAYATADAWTFSLNSEATYDWKSAQWAVPLNLAASKVVTVGGRPVSLGAGVRYHAESPEGGARGWGARLVVTLLFPH